MLAHIEQRSYIHALKIIYTLRASIALAVSTSSIINFKHSTALLWAAMCSKLYLSLLRWAVSLGPPSAHSKAYGSGEIVSTD